MWLGLFILFYSFIFNDGKHFNGGTIRWAPVDPYDNSSSLDITITQSYSWTYPNVKCANNVPISSSAYASTNSNLTCVVDCSTDGGYSSAPIDILTNCTSASSSLNMMTSERLKNITLSAGAHFYLAYRGNAWLPLNDPAESNLEWSIVTYIDLRKRSDGFINTPPVATIVSPPVATIVSPQYAIVNRTIQINIPVSDANAGDDIRCRWSTYTSGYRRRKRSNKEEHINHPSDNHFYEKLDNDREFIHVRRKRACSKACTTLCINGCQCSCDECDPTICNGTSCTLSSGCATPATTTTVVAPFTTVATPTTTIKTTTITINITTTETQGTLKSTSSYPIRQAVDECSDICYPSSVPNAQESSSPIRTKYLITLGSVGRAIRSKY
ncbi:unnamed protein product [Rotaria sordida]|uniref:Uncharacterized protein n=1 Tax=Rotaria sordida TaxID=392033 RepID=A0A814VQ50_9BILA|nr:unnamed protein product [Rotaria sordida]